MHAHTVSPLISIRSDARRSFFADDLRCVVPFGNSQSGSLSLHYCINILLPIIYTSRWEITYSAPTKEAKCWLLPGLVHRYKYMYAFGSCSVHKLRYLLQQNICTPWRCCSASKTNRVVCVQALSFVVCLCVVT
jgi:hypothetical protein